nr:TRAP transporter large permease [Acuticoccus mangrovi]
MLIGGLWIPFAIGLTSLVYIYLVQGPFGMNAIGFIAWDATNSFTLTAIPLFILLAELLIRSGVATRVYDGLSRMVRFLPGGLLQTNIAGCAVFSAISGSSVATAAGIGSVAMPQLLARGYSRPMAAGSLAAGGTLGILIPPSIAMIVYGSFTETSVAQLFFAGLIPGLMMAGLFMLYIGIRAILVPSVAPRETVEEGDHIPALSWRTAADILPFAVLIGLTLGSIYQGIVTPTEAAAFGCVVTLLIAAIWGKFNFTVLRESLRAAMITSASLMFIILSAHFFAYAVSVDGLGQRLTDTLLGMDLSKTQLLFAIVVLFLVMGCFVEAIGIMVITLPVLYPVLTGFGIDLVWFGVMMVILIEIGQLTPPLGINIFVIQGIWDGRLPEVIRGVVPFFFLMLLALALVWIFPDIATYLPRNITSR